MKAWFTTLGALLAAVMVGLLIYAAVSSPLVMLVLQAGIVAVIAAAGLTLVGALILGVFYLVHQVESWWIVTETKRNQAVQLFGHEGQVYAVNTGGVPIQPLHLPAARDDLTLDLWRTWTLRRRPTGQVIDLPSPEAPLELPAPTIPQVVRLEDIFDPAQASIRNLILGAGPGGQLVTGHLRDLSHVGIGGTSRWGKSTFLQAILYQLVVSLEPIDFYLSDVGGTAFISFGLPFADSVAASERLVARVYDLYQERHGQFAAAGRQAGYGIRSLDIYNRLTGENLPYVVLAIDEATALMADSREMAHQISQLILQAGKYGIWLLLSGQNWKAKNVETTIRDQFSSRFQFKAMDRYQASVLIPGSGAQDFTIKGRAAIVLPGAVSVQTIQTPLVDEATIAAAPKPRRPSDLEWIVADEPETGDVPADSLDPDRAAKIRELFAAGMSKTEIAQYFGYKTNSGSIFYEIKAALDDE